MSKAEERVLDIVFAVFDMVLILCISILLSRFIDKSVFFLPLAWLARKIYLKCIPSKRLIDYLIQEGEK